MLIIITIAVHLNHTATAGSQMMKDSKLPGPPQGSVPLTFLLWGRCQGESPDVEEPLGQGGPAANVWAKPASCSLQNESPFSVYRTWGSLSAVPGMNEAAWSSADMMLGGWGRGGSRTNAFSTLTLQRKTEAPSGEGSCSRPPAGTHTR